jgi:hypothetical protein
MSSVANASGGADPLREHVVGLTLRGFGVTCRHAARFGLPWASANCCSLVYGTHLDQPAEILRQSAGIV